MNLIKDPFKNWLAFLNLTAMCDYKGMQYATGQKWQDGCQYDCECIDGSTGQYRCTEKYVICDHSFDHNIKMLFIIESELTCIDESMCTFYLT